MASNLQEFLAKLALKYGLYASRYEVYTNILERFVKIIKESKRRVVCLDLGCGDGFFTRFLAGLCDLSIGIDLNEYSTWRYRWKNNSFFIVADARRIPLHPSSVDLVTIISLLEHVSNWRSIIAETSRILRLGGLVVIQVPNLNALMEPHTHLPFISFMPVHLRNLITTSMFNETLQWDCTLREVIQALKDSGLKILGVFHYAYMPKLKPLAFSYFIIAMKHEIN
jgi:ubiquinone/menaquinone biosynthesis C-methylase UbiE